MKEGLASSVVFAILFAGRRNTACKGSKDKRSRRMYESAEMAGTARRKHGTHGMDVCAEPKESWRKGDSAPWIRIFINFNLTIVRKAYVISK